MKIYIGPYKNCIGPYQIAEKILFWKDKDSKAVEWLASKIAVKLGNTVFFKSDRKINIKIDNYDLWNMDHTLSLIILPMLTKLKASKNGYPYVSNDDVPDSLKNKDEDEFVESRWNWVLDELIWAFNNLTDEAGYFKIANSEERTQYQNRIENGLRLFGKYYQDLWT